MKRIITVLAMTLLTLNTTAQNLRTCAICDLKEIKIEELKNKELFEIELLRNEIFARHHYVFKNKRLIKYFSKYPWYRPSKDFTPLNEFEKKNIETFKKKENEITSYRNSMINELKKLKNAINKSDKNHLKGVYNNYEEDYYDVYLSTIQQVLNFVNLDAIHWHKGKGLYSVKIDNGFAIDNYELLIVKGSIILSVSNSTYSSLMNDKDAWEYPSNYYSEEYETYLSLDLKLINGNLKVTDILMAG